MLIAGLFYLALVSAAPQAKPPASPPEFERGAPDKLLIHESTDEAGKARKYLDSVARCVASNHRKQSAAGLALPYGSAEQAAAFNALIQVEDSCFGPIFSSMSIHFDTQALAAGAAEFFLANFKALEDARRHDPKAFVWPPLNAMDGFGDCAVSQGETQVRAFIDTPVASDAEQSAAQALAPALGQCVSEGQTIAVEPAAMRQILAVALYRRVAVPPPAVPAAAQPATP
jgi:hypothetical protein